MKSIAASTSPNLFPDTWLAYVFANWMRLQRLTRPKGNPEGLSGFIRRAIVSAEQNCFLATSARRLKPRQERETPPSWG